MIPLSAEQPTPATSDQPRPRPTIYLVYSNKAQAWWRENGSGYTQNIWDAGRYDEDGARKACQMRTWSLGAQPPEVMVPAPEESQNTLFSVTGIRAAQKDSWNRIKEATRQAIAEREAGDRS